jgi:hypothetical protein
VALLALLGAGALSPALGRRISEYQ